MCGLGSIDTNHFNPSSGFGFASVHPLSLESYPLLWPRITFQALFEHISVLLLAFLSGLIGGEHRGDITGSFTAHSHLSPFLRIERAAFRAPPPATTPPNL